MNTELMERADAAIAPATDEVTVFERLAKDPTVDVEKLQRLIDMHADLKRMQAKSAFDQAFSIMQGDIPAIEEKAKTNNGTYAPLEDIISKVRPILKVNGFYLTFRTEWPDQKTVRVIGILAHKDGHERTSEFLSGADTSGNKNAIQGLASAVSYGQRYTVKDLLNITTRGADNDGATAGKAAPEEPAGYEDWLDMLTAVAEEKEPEKLKAAWEKAKPMYRSYLTKHTPQVWAGLKKTAGAL